MNNFSNKIRKVTVGNEINNQMNYVVGSMHTFFIEGERQKREIRDIIETEDHYMIYLLGENNEVQLWKQLPKNNQTSVEFIID